MVNKIILNKQCLVLTDRALKSPSRSGFLGQTSVDKCRNKGTRMRLFVFKPLEKHRCMTREARTLCFLGFDITVEFRCRWFRELSR